ncbi:MAG TPA: glycosyltransferase family 87 protein, partial [Pseudomonadales bacterium]|nr:glycosyltransferase family 87 protein [Pseudomonadales bacterium]
MAQRFLSPENFYFPKIKDYFWKIYPVVVLFFFLLSFLYLIFPLKDVLRTWCDFRWLYVAGKTWLSGHSPYNFSAWADQWMETPFTFIGGYPSQPFFYPPHWGAIVVPLAKLPYLDALRVWDFINVVSYLASLYLCMKIVMPTLTSVNARRLAWFMLGLASLVGSVRWAFGVSQMGFLPLLGMVGLYWAWLRGLFHWQVIFTVVALL